MYGAVRRRWEDAATGRGEAPEAGATLVEFAVVAGLLFLLVFGIIEFGLAFRDRLTVANATQSSARVASTMGDADETDYEMLLNLEQSLQTLPNSGIDTVRFVDLYLAAPDGSPMGSCASGDRCNRYFYRPDPNTTCDWVPCPDPNSGYSAWPWAPEDRDVALPGLDVIAVRVTFSHEWVTGGIVPLPRVDCPAPGVRCWADTALIRLEPQVFEL